MPQLQIIQQTGYILSENREEMDRFMDHMQIKIIHKLKKTIGEQDINFTGDMTKSIEKGKEDGLHIISINSPYAHLVDRGLSPGTWVNYEKLKIWVQGKIGITEEPELSSVTWKILKKIQRDGIRPRRFVKKALKAFIGQFGTPSVRRVGSKRSKSGQWLNKISKAIRKINKNLRKISKNISKVTKPLGRYK